MSSISSRARRGASWSALAVAWFLAVPSAHAVGHVVGSCQGTSDKPQSKIWYNDGFYWTVLESSSGSAILQLVNDNWIERLEVDSHVNSGDDGHEDVLWNGTELFVLVYQSHPSVYKYTYDTLLDNYELVSGFPVSFDIPSGSETMVFDQDSTGRLWATYEAGGDIYAAYSSADQRTWTAPGVVLRSGVNDDDVASVVAFGGNKIGVFWSDQNRWEFGFRVHSDGAAPDSWGSVEVVHAGSGNSDDHLNLAVDHSGRVYAITKDVANEFAVHRRDTNGDWTTKTNITGGQNGTRPVLMLDANETKLYALYTCWSCGGIDPILYRVGSTSTLSFGSATTFLTSGSQSLNNVTDMKQTLPPNSLVAIGHGGGTAYWNGWGSPPPGNGFGEESGGGDPPPPPPPSSEPPPPPPPPPPLLPPGAPMAVAASGAVRHSAPGIVAAFLFDESSGEAAENGLDTAQKGTLGAPGADTAEPLRVEGVEGGALRFDGANDWVEVPSAIAPGLPGSFTIEAWVRRIAPGSPDVVLAKESSSARNYRLRFTSSNVLELAWKSTSGSSRTTLGLTPVTDDQWHHIAAVRDFEAHQDRIYLDGRLDGQRTDSSAPGASTDNLLIGARRSSGIKEPFHGDIDLVRIASQVLYSNDFTPPTGYDLGPAQPYAIVQWSAPATGGAPTGYMVYRGTNGEDPMLVTPAAVPELSWADPDPVDGILEYRVAAVNTEGQGPQSSVAKLTFGAGPTQPDAPARTGATPIHRIVPLEGNAIYRFDDAPGATTAADGSANGLNLTLGSGALGDAAEPAWIAGTTGGGLQFDGIDDHADAADDPRLRFDAAFTLEAWVRPAALGRYGVLIAKESTSAGRNYRLALTTTGKLELQWKNTAGTVHTSSSSATLVAGAWQHVAAVFDPTLGTSRLFLNGTPVATKATVGTPEPGGPAMLRLGARQSSSLKDFFTGDLDLVRLTPRALYRDAFVPPSVYAPQPVSEHRVVWSEAIPGSARITGYLLERCFGDGAWERLTSTPLAGLEMTLPELAPKTRVGYRVVAIDRLGLESPASSACWLYRRAETPAPVLEKSTLPAAVAMTVGPNPFNPSTTIELQLPHDADVDIRVHDASGRVVRRLVTARMAAGEHRVVWDGRDEQHAAAASGVYFLLVQAGDQARHLKLVLAK